MKNPCGPARWATRFGLWPNIFRRCGSRNPRQPTRAYIAEASASPWADVKTGTPARLYGRRIDYSGLVRQTATRRPCPSRSHSSHARDTTPQIGLPRSRTTPANARHHPPTSIRRRCTRAAIDSVRPTLLSLDRGQGRCASRPRTASDFPRAGRLDDPTVLSQRDLDLPPRDVQLALLQTIPGLKRASGFGRAHARIRSYRDPLEHSTRRWRPPCRDWYMAGLDHGTTGYEEARPKPTGRLNAGPRGRRLGVSFWLTVPTASSVVLIDVVVSLGVPNPIGCSLRAEYRLWPAGPTMPTKRLTARASHGAASASNGARVFHVKTIGRWSGSRLARRLTCHPAGVGRQGYGYQPGTGVVRSAPIYWPS